MAQEDPYPACRFYVKVEGLTEGTFEGVFTEVGGLQMEMEVTEYAEGGINNFVYRLPGRTKVGNITLRRGMIASNSLFKWYLDVAQGKIVRRNVSVTMFVAGKSELRWSFIGAFPVKWIGPQLVATATVVGVEELELAHNGLQPDG